MQASTTIHLNANQQYILALLLSNGGKLGDPVTLDVSSNMRAARDVLIRIGAIVRGSSIDITEKGVRLAVDEGLAEPSGKLTEKGRQSIYAVESFTLLRELLHGGDGQ